MTQHVIATASQGDIPAAPEPLARPALLSVIVPTFNERENVAELVTRLARTLRGVDWEVVFVDDDSTDGTPAVLRSLAQSNPKVRFIHRIGRRGLSSAVVEGIQSTSSPFVAVMDADLQHDESLLPRMLERLRNSGSDVVVGSRYVEHGGVGDWDSRRQMISQVATRLAHYFLPSKLSDPMSGFFMLKREAFDQSVRQLSSLGYKILLDILISARSRLVVEELPYVFRSRVHGESKLDSAVAWEYLMLLFDKSFGRFVPARLVMFGIVGSAGVIVHMALLALLSQGLYVSFTLSQTAATFAAMTFNFFANNAFTYRDKRLRGFWPILGGLLSFYAVCSIGTVSNVGIASFLFMQDYSWWLSGLGGILVGIVWNYAATSIITWGKK